MPLFDWIGFDADDTLWDNERLYISGQARFVALVAPYCSEAQARARLDEAEARNMALFGYGIKAFTLSMIETAIELSGGKIGAHELGRLVAYAREMLAAGVQLAENARQTVARLSETHPLMVITKGDPLEQEAKLARSGLQEYFQHIEVVSDKVEENYRRIFRRYAIQPQRFIMIGNSLRSDILPVLQLGGSAVYIPYANTWLHEAAELPAEGQPGFYQLAGLAELPGLLARLESQSG